MYGSQLAERAWRPLVLSGVPTTLGAAVTPSQPTATFQSGAPLFQVGVKSVSLFQEGAPSIAGAAATQTARARVTADTANFIVKLRCLCIPFTDYILRPWYHKGWTSRAMLAPACFWFFHVLVYVRSMGCLCTKEGVSPFHLSPDAKPRKKCGVGWCGPLEFLVDGCHGR